VADEEALFVVVGIDETSRRCLQRRRYAPRRCQDGKTSTPFDPDLDLPFLGIQDGNIRLAEDDEQVALAGVLQIIGHVQIGIHARLEDRDGAQLAEFRGLGVIV